MVSCMNVRGCVSVPEKTLEHWCSQYIALRYKSRVALWWPARGQDIDFRLLPAAPGKAIQLELKTTTVTGPGLHEVKVDLGQLWEYRQRALGHQPFYVFPEPGWPGNLEETANAQGRAVTELAYRRSGPGWWFADWLMVMTAGEVAEVLAKELKEHGSPDRGKPARLVRYDVAKPTPDGRPSAEWGAAGDTSFGPVRWREFWSELERCGRPDWPQLVRVPARLVKEERGPFHHQDIGWIFRNLVPDWPKVAADGMRDPIAATQERFVTLIPDAEGTYRVSRSAGDTTDTRQQPTDDTEVRDEYIDLRQVVFLDASALL